MANTIVPYLWFKTQANDAANFYTSVFTVSKFTGWTGKSTYQLTNCQPRAAGKKIAKICGQIHAGSADLADTHGPAMQVVGTTVNVRQIG